MLYSLDKSVLVVIDIQGNLAATMHNKENVFANIVRLMKAAKLLSMPMLITEQVPEKIGDTIPEISQHIPNHISPISKESFSCWQCAAFQKELTQLGRQEIILCGIESHVCVSQTGLDLIAAGYRVGCAVDAMSARCEANHQHGVNRLMAAGADMVCTEMIATEWLKSSAHPAFREILKLIK